MLLAQYFKIHELLSVLVFAFGSVLFLLTKGDFLPLVALICVAIVSADKRVSIQRCSDNAAHWRSVFPNSYVTNATNDPISN